MWVLQIDPNSLDVLRLTPHCVRVSSSRVDFTTTCDDDLSSSSPISRSSWVSLLQRLGLVSCSPLFRSCISLFRVVPVKPVGSRVMKFTQALFAIVAISSVAGREVGANPELARASKTTEDFPGDSETAGSLNAHLRGYLSAVGVPRLSPSSNSKSLGFLPLGAFHLFHSVTIS